MNEHPVTPPPELFADWLAEARRLHPTESTGFIAGEIARIAYRTGADQELQACGEWLMLNGYGAVISRLRAARRPKPPSLKEQALEALDEEQAELSIQNYKLIRAVLESLPDHE
jgi:hypothetical protein